MSKLVRLGVFVAAVAMAGSFVGAWGWNEFSRWRQQRADEEKKAAAAAFEASPQGVQRAAVRSALKDPDSAQFRGDVPSPNVKGVWCGYVNARNGMGGMAGETRYVAEVNPDRELAVLDRVYFEPSPDVISDPKKLEREIFLSKWRTICEKSTPG